MNLLEDIRNWFGKEQAKVLADLHGDFVALKARVEALEGKAAAVVPSTQGAPSVQEAQVQETAKA